MAGHDPARAPHRERTFWCGLALVLVALKAALLAVDPTVRFFLGDSESYLQGCFTGFVPPDRSALYPLLIRWTAGRAHSLLALTAAQSLAGVAGALCVAWILRGSFGLRRWRTAAVAVAVCVEPAQLFYERMVMAESFATANVLAMFACGFAYLRTRRWPWLPAVAFLGIVAVALRVSTLPVVLGFALLPVLLAPRAGARRRREFWLHLAIAVVATAAAHSLWRWEYGRRARCPADYLEHSGLFRLGLVAPLVGERQLAAEGLAQLAQEVVPSLTDPRERDNHLWHEQGLIAVLQRARGAQADAVARRLAWRAVRADPAGLLRLGWSNLLDHFDGGTASRAMTRDIGDRPLPADLVAELRARFGHDATDVHELRTPVSRWFLGSIAWLRLCLVALPFAALAAAIAHRRSARAAGLLLAGRPRPSPTAVPRAPPACCSPGARSSWRRRTSCSPTR